MLPTTTLGNEIGLTDQQINEWPKAEGSLALLGQWPAGDPLVFSAPPVERAVPVCRRLALLWLDAEQIHDADARYTVQLVLSELITNAIQHSDSSRVRGRLWRSGDALFVEVRDQGGTWSTPRASRAGGAEDHGRGLNLVADSTRGWGRRFGVDGSCAVWAAVPLTRRAWEGVNDGH